MTQENENQPKWYIDENLPGMGDRPSCLPEKFKSVADLSKSYSELEKKLASSVPESYDFSKSKYIDPDYAPFQDLQSLGKEKRVPKEFVDKMLESFDKYMDEFNIDPEEEMKKLGDDAKERLTVLNNWAKATLSQQSYEALAGKLTNAESIKAFEELRGKIMSNNIQVPNQNTTPQQSLTIDDLKSELADNLEKYKSDKSYREDYRRRLEVAAKSSKDFVDKVGS